MRLFKRSWLLVVVTLFCLGFMGCTEKFDIADETIKAQVKDYFLSKNAVAGISMPSIGSNSQSKIVYFSDEFEVLSIDIVDKAIKDSHAKIVCKVKYKNKGPGASLGGSSGSWNAGSFLPLITSKSAPNSGDVGEGESVFTFQKFDKGWRMEIPASKGF